MAKQQIIFLAFLLINIFCVDAIGQSGCLTSAGAVYGAPNHNERGYCVVATQGNDGIYLVGFKDDSILLARFNLEGVPLWTKTFDIVAGEEEHIFEMIMDSEGMLTAVGTAGDEALGGTVVAFRFNPNTLQLIWAHEYVSVIPRDYGETIVQIGTGNFIIGNNPTMVTLENDLELIWLDKNTGDIVPGFMKNYNLGGSDRMMEMLYYNNFIYAVARYTDGLGNDKMRHTLVKYDPATGIHVWSKLGHIPQSGTARLYGEDLIIEQNEIYSICYGDPVGVSTTNTKIYCQKSSIDGDLIWLKQYELPGNTDFCYEMIKSDGGIVILAGRKATPVQLILFKIDLSGNLLWSKTFAFTNLTIPQVRVGGGQMMEVAGQIVFTGYGNGSSGSTDLILVRTDLNGEVNIPCVDDQNIAIPVITVSNPSFYNKTVTQFNVNLVDNEEFPEVMDAPLPPVCPVTDTLFSLVDANVCDGELYEGYSEAGTYEDYFTTSEGCDSLRILNLDIIFPSNAFEQVTICLGDTYAGYSATGTYMDTFQNILGCDSIQILMLTVVPEETTIDEIICEGDSYDGYTETGSYVDTLQGISTDCDTIRYLNLTVTPAQQTDINQSICEGESYEGYTTTGIYTDVFINAQGCDSIRILDLTVNADDLTNETVSLCLGESYNGFSESGTYTSMFQNVFGCDSTHILTLEVIPLETNLFIEICEGELYEGYSQSGFYEDTLQGPSGECDTIRYLDLTVNPPDMTNFVISICTGDDYEGYTTSGQYTDVFVNQYGCDSTRVLDLTVTSEINTEIEVTICDGESYEGYTVAGVYTDNFTSVFGCDSIRLLTLSIGQPEIQSSISICDGESYLGYSTTGDYVITIPGASGACDTTLHLSLQVDPLYAFDIDQTICTGGNYLGYTSTGVYIDTLDNSGGCDSVRTLSLFVLNELNSNIQVTVCHGEVYEGYQDEGIYVDTFTSVYGCDSIRTLDLHLSFLTKDVSVSLCSGGSYEGHTTGGIYTDTLYGPPGMCDTLRNLVIAITPPLLTYINAGVCAGQSFLGYNQTGMYADTFQTIDGCDSVRMLNLTVDNQIQTTEMKSICAGQSYQGYFVPGTYLDTFTSAFGCDSIRFLQLDIETPVLQLAISICQGESYLGYSQSGMFEDTLAGMLNECDTLRQLSLTVLPVIESMMTTSICTGQSFDGYTSSGIYSDTFKTEGGCDSVRILELIVTDILVSSQTISICFGQSYEGYTDPGFYVDTFQSSFYCDSLRELTLQIELPEKHIMAEICAGQIFEQHNISGTYLDTIMGAAGECDTLRELNLIVHPAQVFQLDEVICDGESYLGYSQAGIFLDTLTTADGCDSIRELHLQMLNPATQTIHASICEQVLTSYQHPGTYVDTLISYLGCDSIVRIVIDDAGLYIPNVFSPNDDGINDVFTVYPYPVSELNIEYFAIYDRFGDMVYETEKWPIFWFGGDRNGKPFQPAVFAYVLIYLCGEDQIVKHGNVTLIK